MPSDRGRLLEVEQVSDDSDEAYVKSGVEHTEGCRSIDEVNGAL